MTSGPVPRQDRIPFLSVAALSAASVAYELVLMRVFSISLWHHFAYMVISLALLGFGFSGTLLALTREFAVRHFRIALVANACLFSVGVVACTAIAMRIPFHPEQLLWEPWQLVNLGGVYLVLALPFFFAANAIGLVLTVFSENGHLVYAADLLGAGLGSLGLLAALYRFWPGEALLLISALGLIAAGAGAMEVRWGRGFVAIAVSAIVVAALSTMPGDLLKPVVSPYKGLNHALNVPGAKIVGERSGPLGLLTVVASEKVPFRYLPGLSLNAIQEPPDQVAIFADADGMTAINRAGVGPQPELLSQTTGALPYVLKRPGEVLIVGLGGGAEILRALSASAGTIDVIELNPQRIDLLAEDYLEYSGRLLEKPNVHVIEGDARGFLASGEHRYDLIQLDMAGSFGASSAGLMALGTDYLRTVEGIRLMLASLTPGGLLALTQWVKLPPRDGMKVLATVIDALREEGSSAPGERFVMIRGWQTSTVVVGNRSFSPAQIIELRDFCDRLGFDLVWFPDMPASLANRYNRLRRPLFHDAASAMLGGSPDDFVAAYKFNIAPAVDDRPYFSNFFRWSALPEILELRGQGGIALLESGYLALIAVLAQACLIASVLIVLPLLVFRGPKVERRRGQQRGRVLVYFGAIGLAFLLIEISFLQKFALFLGHPVRSAAIVLSSFLVFAGLGSAFEHRLESATGRSRSRTVAVATISVLAIASVVGLDHVFATLGALSWMLKAVVAATVIAPLAFAMGLPFPLAVRSLDPSLVPWAWAINGCASVISAALAMLLAMHFGFSLVILLGVMLYWVAGISLPVPDQQSGAGPSREAAATPASRWVSTGSPCGRCRIASSSARSYPGRR